ncbi:hypothetical protein [Actinomadura rudentiformis]|uniref:Uncharacterized protein n=1 Tax=Actinomadura rudentiformis TaxID=359158 RepID=A0A6H9Y7D1_9ACTN|nr:hypothetical protein [Actinomadura rudentiformis]KAB2339786.1 hypothetical protein F8566_46805 [Actinomadura rudentiformis]
MRPTHGIREELAGRAIEQRTPRRTYLSDSQENGRFPIPAVRIAGTDDLIAVMRGSGLHGVVASQIERARSGFEVDAEGKPTLESFAELLSVLDESDREAVRQSEEKTRATMRFWDLLIRTGMLHVDRTRSLAWPGPAALAITGSDADAALDAWQTFLIAMLDHWSLSERQDVEEIGLCTNLLVFLYTQDDLVMHEHLSPTPDPKARECVRVHVGLLTHAGLVEQDDVGVWISPLGTLVCRAMLEEASGLTIPAVGSYAGADATTLLEALSSYRVDHISDEVRAWLSERSVEAGAAEIRNALRGVDPIARRAGFDLLAGTMDEAFGKVGRRVLLELVEDDELGALAFNFLTAKEKEQASVPDTAANAWALVDLAAVRLQAGTPAAEMIERLGYVDQDPEKMAKLISLFGDVDHPWNVRVLEAMVAHHPQPEVAEAARLALHRLVPTAGSSLP